MRPRQSTLPAEPEPSEPRAASFVVRVWLDEPELASWQGHITHVQSGERRHVRTLHQIATFIALRLKAVGYKRPPPRGFRRWFRPWSTRDGTGERDGGR